jgi:ATP-dependent DNA helicase RecG
MPIPVVDISPHDVANVLATAEGHFTDVKAIEVAPAKLTKSLSAFGNADGGEILIGIDERGRSKKRSWRGFVDVEAANGHL